MRDRLYKKVDRADVVDQRYDQKNYKRNYQNQVDKLVHSNSCLNAGFQLQRDIINIPRAHNHQYVGTGGILVQFIQNRAIRDIFHR